MLQKYAPKLFTLHTLGDYAKQCTSCDHDDAVPGLGLTAAAREPRETNQ